MDWFDSSPPRLLRLDLNNQSRQWHLLAFINWSEDERSYSLPLKGFDLPPGEYFSREFWSGNVDRVSGDQLPLESISPHGVKLFALTPCEALEGHLRMGEPCYLGSDLHISQGLEVAEWTLLSGNKLLLRFDLLAKTPGVFDLYLPREPIEVVMKDGDMQWNQVGQNIYQFRGDLYPSAAVIISC
jgi:alpha-galactosidase